MRFGENSGMHFSNLRLPSCNLRGGGSALAMTDATFCALGIGMSTAEDACSTASQPSTGTMMETLSRRRTLRLSENFRLLTE